MLEDGRLQEDVDRAREVNANTGSGSVRRSSGDDFTPAHSPFDWATGYEDVGSFVSRKRSDWATEPTGRSGSRARRGYDAGHRRPAPTPQPGQTSEPRAPRYAESQRRATGSQSPTAAAQSPFDWATGYEDVGSFVSRKRSDWATEPTVRLRPGNPAQRYAERRRPAPEPQPGQTTEPRAALFAESRRRPPDLQPDTARQQTEMPLEPRSAGDTVIDKRARELAQPAIDDYFAGRIAEEELRQRKHAAYERASAELFARFEKADDLANFEKAYRTYATAAAARVEAEEALAKAVMAEEQAAGEVDKALGGGAAGDHA